MDISPGPPFWRIIDDDMDIPLLDQLSLSGRPDADIHGAVNFAFTAFSEVRAWREGHEGRCHISKITWSLPPDVTPFSTRGGI